MTDEQWVTKIKATLYGSPEFRRRVVAQLKKAGASDAQILEALRDYRARGRRDG